ncbi:hypothetical protein S510_003603 [Salmonella enterica subsp. arizonae]|nr:hypothetical protein [Salmonella enterica subsp. arizonae]EJJ0533240.1 hypothetical protein [Salmonella enterica]
MTKYNFIIYSLLLAVVPISVSADSSTTSAAPVGRLSPPTAPSVGHRPPKNLSGVELTFNGVGFSIFSYTPFPGMTLKRESIHRAPDPDNNYQAAETYTVVCTYYQVNKDNSQHILKRESPCQYNFNIKKEHSGSRIKLEVYNETDITSASGYMPVPSVSEPHYIETQPISNTPSPDLTLINIDNAVLSPGESATITTLVKDVDGNPINDVMIDIATANQNGNGLWDIGPVKKGVGPGEYTQVITYLGNHSETLGVEYSYQGDFFKKYLSIIGRL